METCQCGLYRQTKAGTSTDDNGVVRCNACGRPVESSTVLPPAVVIAADMITTLSELPGYRIVRSRGVVSELAGSSGFTATSKGEAALAGAMSALSRSAGGLGANAIVGLNASTFGAGGGITSAFGGDAVGVLVVGTAVTVEPLSNG